MTQRNLERGLTVLAVCAMIAGCVDSEAPLSDPASSRVDQRLLGAWQLQIDHREFHYYFVGSQPQMVVFDKLPDGVMVATLVMRDKRGRYYSPADGYEGEHFTFHRGGRPR